MPTTVIERIGGKSAVGIGVETSFGAGGPITEFAPDTACSIDPAPGIFQPELMMNLRDLHAYNLQGQIKVAGAVTGPLFPINGMEWLAAAIGLDAGQCGASILSPKTGTLGAPAVIGATSITYSTGGAAPIIGEFYQITGAAGMALAGQEVIKVETFSGTTSPYTINFPAHPLKYAHSNTDPVTQVASVFSHLFIESDIIPSLVIEKNVGGFEAVQYNGCRINKWSLKFAATDTAAEYTADIIGKDYNILTTPTAVVNDSVKPFVFSEAVISAFGQNIYHADSLQMDLDNTVKPSWTFNNTHFANFITSTGFAASGNLHAVWQSEDDVDWGYFNKAVGAVEGSMAVTMVHPITMESVTINLPQIILSGYTEELKTKDIIYVSLKWLARYDLNATNKTVSAVAANSRWYPY